MHHEGLESSFFRLGSGVVVKKNSSTTPVEKLRAGHAEFPGKASLPGFFAQTLQILFGPARIWQNREARQGKIPAGTFPVSAGNLQIPENCAACEGCRGEENFGGAGDRSGPRFGTPAAL